MEKNKTTCRNCRQAVWRILDGKFENQKDKRWIGEDGKQWSGLVCPTCHTELTRQRTNERRAKERAKREARRLKREQTT